MSYVDFIYCLNYYRIVSRNDYDHTSLIYVSRPHFSAIRHIDSRSSIYCGSPQLKARFDNRYLLPKYESINRIKNRMLSIVIAIKLAQFFSSRANILCFLIEYK